MSSVLKKTGLTMAIAAAGLFAATSANAITAPHGDEAKVHCYGVTACKGQNDCKTDKNACKGKASCKGHGFKSMTDKECKAAGGHMKKMKMKKAH
jgi:uncharacterized membrane protein